MQIKRVGLENLSKLDCNSVVEHMHNICEALGSIQEPKPNKGQQKYV